MKLLSALHSWRVTPADAIKIQQRLARRISHRQVFPFQFRWVAGLDAAFSRDGRTCIGGVVVWDATEKRVLESHVARVPVTFPYIPGLLSFREAPALLSALKKVECVPDLLICDGQGLAHPRRFGIACHIGLWCDLPTIGCAKSRLVGQHEPLRLVRGNRVPLSDGGEVIGAVLCTRNGVKPVFVSVGHKIQLETAIDCVLSCCTQYRLPEPVRLADKLVRGAKSA